MMVSLAEALLTIPEWLTGESDQKEYDTPTKLRHELDEYTEQYIKTVTSSIDGEPRQQLMTTFLGQVMEMYGIICKHFARAMAEADRIATDEGLKESIKLYAVQIGDITENAYRREMYEPLEDMKKIMDVMYHMYDLNSRTPLAETMEIISNAEERLADILRKAKKKQEEHTRAYAELYRKNYCKEVVEKGRVYYELYNVPMSEDIPDGCRVIDFVCRRDDGSIEMPSTIQTMCVKLRKRFPELEGFHFHILRHSFSSNLLGSGVDPKAVQELMGHSDVSTTMNIYGHASREAKKNAGLVMDSIGNPGKGNLSLVSPDEGKNKGKETPKKRKMA